MRVDISVYWEAGENPARTRHCNPLNIALNATVDLSMGR